jgi:hypothetical protein
MPRYTNIIKCFNARGGKDSPIAIIIPYKIRKEFEIKSGDIFEVAFDKKGRLIYKKVQSL